MEDNNSPEYDAFIEKFKSRRSSDDCFTPGNVYDVVLGWASKRYGFDPSVAVRPFWPGRDYTAATYPDGCPVVDNPPFSILAKIVKWFNANGIRFFLFAPSLTSLSICRDGKTAFIAAHITITFDNGAKVNVSFVTNMEPPDVLATTASDLHDAIGAANTENESRPPKHTEKLRLPNELITSARMGYLSVHHTPYMLRRSDAVFVRKLDNYGTGIYGGGFLLSARAAAERAAAERAAAERAAAERAAAKTIKLSNREKAVTKGL